MSAADISRNEKYSRCVALENDYVHKVYENIGKDLAEAKDPMQDTVKMFLDGLEPGSLVADIGCGDGKHLKDKDGLFSVGVEKCTSQASLARQRCQEVLLGDNLRLPYRNDTFDAALSIEVLHHFTTKERRIEALKEISRILRIGGRALITVQRHNNKISQDVLIPWFDVPKEKKMKEDEWFDDDNFQNGYYGEEDDEDSISLPSSDEEDAMLINNAKFSATEKSNSNSRRNSRNQISKNMLTSNPVPKNQNIVQDACYAFVQRAFKIFSSDNAISNDYSYKLPLRARDGTDVPLHTVNRNDKRTRQLNCSCLKMNESFLTTISENFIELMNIDIDKETSDYLPEENSKLVHKRSTLIRSFSDIFKNINSLWSSKFTKSCSDLKSLCMTDARRKENEEMRNRLVRSSTTTTCSPTFGHINPKENVEDFNITVGEAKQIINDFSNSLLSRVETVRYTEDGSENNRITHSDIVNGNTLPSECSAIKTPHSKDKININKKNLISKMPLLKEEDFYHDDSTNNLDVEEKPIPSKSIDYHCKSVQISESPMQDSFSVAGYNSKYDIHSVEKNILNDKKTFTFSEKEKFIFDRSLIEANLRKEYSFLYESSDDDEEENNLDSDEGGYEEPVISHMRNNFTANDDSQPSFIDEDSIYFFESVDRDTLERRHTKTKHEIKKLQPLDINNMSALKQKSNLISNDTLKKRSSKSSMKTDTKHLNSQMEDDICKFDCSVDPASSNTKYFPHNSPKTIFKEHQINKFSKLNALGQYYEDDNEVPYSNQDFPLVPYYSMPELYAMSEFYDEYILYQKYLHDRGYSGLTNYDYPFLKSFYSKKEEKEIQNKLKISKPIEVNLMKDDAETETDIKKEKILDAGICSGKDSEETNHKVQESNEKNDPNESVTSESSIENLKKEICNNIQTAFFSSDSSPIENKWESISDIPELMFANEKQKVPDSINLKDNFISDIDNKLTYKPGLNSRSSNVEFKNSFVYFASLGISRSCSSLHENPNFNKLVEIPSSPNISASQPSLKFSPKRDIKSNLNKYRLNQINLYHSLSSDLLVDEDIFSNLRQRAAKKTIYSKQNMCALNDVKSDADNSVQIITNILEKCPHEVSYISSPNLTDFKEISPNFSKFISNDKLQSHSELLVTSDSFTDKVYNNETLSMYENCRNSDSNKFLDSCCETPHIPYLIENTKECNKYFSSTEKSNCLGNYAHSLSDLDSMEGKRKIDDFFQEKLPESEKIIENSTVSDLSSQNVTSTVTNHKDSNKSYLLKNFPNENISKLEPLFHITDTGHGRKDDLPSTKRENALESDSHSIEKVIHSDPTEPIDSCPIDSLKKSLNDHSLDTTDVKQCTNYTYGRIHEDGAAVVAHRYHHLFEEEELYDLIENNISDLHVLDSFVEELHLYIIAEKVKVWTI